MSGWEPLASSDPVPGDPEQIKAVARRLADIANAVEQQSARLRGVSAERIWTGDAARRFEADKDDLPPLLDIVRTRYSEAGSALERYAPELAAAQEMARRALAQARAAQADIADAERGVGRMEEYARDERTRVRTAAEAFPDRPAPRPLPWSGPNYHYLLGDAQADLASARDLLEQAIAHNEAAGHAAARVVYDAINDDIRNTLRSRAQAAAHWLTENFPIAELSEILGAIALVATVLAAILTITGVGAPVAAALFAVAKAASVIKLVLDVVLWAADDFSLARGVDVAISIVLVGAAAGLSALAKNAHIAVRAAGVASRANPTWAGSVDDAARAGRFYTRARGFERAGDVVGDAATANDIRTLPGAFEDAQATADIYQSHPLVWGAPGLLLGAAGAVPGVLGAAWLYHQEHRPSRPGSTIDPISPVAPASP